jgi:hypothetical protein
MLTCGHIEPLWNINEFKEQCKSLKFHRFLNSFNEWDYLFGKNDLFSILNKVIS